MDAHYFLGIEVPEQVGRQLQQTAQRLKSICSYRHWMDPRDYHLTLFFFGTLTEERLDRLMPLVEKISAGTIPFPLRTSATESFGDPVHPRVIYSALEPSRPLLLLRKKLEKPLAEDGMRLEKRLFHPHITLAKRWRAGNLTAELAYADESRVFPGWTAEQIVLFKVLPNKLPQYQTVAVFPFAT